MKRLALLALAAVLTGCPTREFYLDRSQVPWEERGITRLALPAFDAPPGAWLVADEARKTLADALSRGTVFVVETNAEAVLQGAITDYVQTSTPAAPRRVLRQSTMAFGQNYTWDVDVTHVVQFTVVMRLNGADGSAVWTRSGNGTSTETVSVTLNWPGSDPVPPPVVAPLPPDPQLFDRLRRNAMSMALTPLLEALTVHYAYRTL